MANENKTHRLNLIGVYVDCRYNKHVLHTVHELDNGLMITIGLYNNNLCKSDDLKVN